MVARIQKLANQVVDFVHKNKEEIGNLHDFFDEQEALAQKLLRIIVNQRGQVFDENKDHERLRINHSELAEFIRLTIQGLDSGLNHNWKSAKDWGVRISHYAMLDMYEKKVEINPWYLDEVGDACQTKDGRVLLGSTWQKEVWDATKKEFKEDSGKNYHGVFWKEELVKMYAKIIDRNDCCFVDKDLKTFLTDNAKCNLIGDVWRYARLDVLVFLIEECDCSPYLRRTRQWVRNSENQELIGNKVYEEVERLNNRRIFHNDASEQELKRVSENWILKKEKEQLLSLSSLNKDIQAKRVAL